MTARIIMKLRVVDRREAPGDMIQLRFAHPKKPLLPPWTPGAHVDLRLPQGRIRQYSLLGDPEDRETYRIAVKREDQGRGGSRWIHDMLRAGDEAHVSMPRNNFPLDPTAERSILVAGGVGVTPMLSMALALRREGRPFTMHYCFRRRATAPLLTELRAICGEALVEHASEDGAAARFRPEEMLRERPEGAHVYCCGPDRLVEAVTGATAHWPEEAAHFEVFQATLDENFNPEPFDLTVASTGRTYRIPADRSALAVLREAGFALPSSCELGVCGTCECGYRDGVVIHRDKVLRPSARQHRMMLCVSRARVGVTVDL